MRWEALFDDMEAQLEAARAADLTAEVADRTRVERATVQLAGRLRAAHGAPLTVRLAGGEVVAGTVLDVAEQWLLLGEGPRRALVPLAAVSALSGLPGLAHPPGVAHVARRLGLGHALRALARDRAVVRVRTDGEELVGLVDRVGADHVDLAPVDRGARRPDGPRAAWTVPFPAIRVVRSG